MTLVVTGFENDLQTIGQQVALDLKTVKGE